MRSHRGIFMLAAAASAAAIMGSSVPAAGGHGTASRSTATMS
jgi:hypothetical protein